MTVPGQGRSPTALDLLFGPAADAPEALAREIMSAGSGKNMSRALESLPAATRDAAVREAAGVASGLLQVDLIGVLVAGWREHRDIVSAARRTLAAPGSTELVSMATHQVTMTQQPSVAVLVDGRRVATLRLGLSIELNVDALLAGISGGRLAALHSGRCDITVKLAIQGTDLLTRQARLELPGVIPLSRGIRLLPVGEYPASRYPGNDHPAVPDTPASLRDGRAFAGEDHAPSGPHAEPLSSG